MNTLKRTKIVCGFMRSVYLSDQKVRQFLRAMTIICFGCSWHLQKGDTSASKTLFAYRA